ncbi:MAG: hypothetical protein QOD33_1139 [Pyrinomonadaceae bacterium]|nr:hypothetical protein [Pyrinomonadaceae bacterium]
MGGPRSGIGDQKAYPPIADRQLGVTVAFLLGVRRPVAALVGWNSIQGFLEFNLLAELRLSVSVGRTPRRCLSLESGLGPSDAPGCPSHSAPLESLVHYSPKFASVVEISKQSSSHGT